MTNSTPGQEHPLALITGASDGIGRAFAERLAAEGYDLVLVARGGDRLKELAGSISDRSGVEVETISADLERPEAVREMKSRAMADARLAMLVNNVGGVGASGGALPFIDQAPETIEAQVALNIGCMLQLTRAALPGMVSRGAGSVINVSSLFAYGAGFEAPGLSISPIYSAAKAFIITFTEVLSRTLAGTGIQMQALVPAFVLTANNKAREKPAGVPGVEPSEVVQASLVGLSLGEVICVPTLDDRSPLNRIHQASNHMMESRYLGLAPRYESH